MASLEDLEARVTALEEQGRQSRQDAAAARILAGAADRDVSDFKQTLNSHTQVLNALRETQVEHGQRLDQLEAKVDSGFTKMNIGMERMTQLIQQVIDKG
jgi:chromosome segregation ATPase